MNPNRSFERRVLEKTHPLDQLASKLFLDEASEKQVRSGENEKKREKGVIEEIDHYIKSEIRISKLETNPKFEFPNPNPFYLRIDLLHIFALVSDFVLRISSFIFARFLPQIDRRSESLPGRSVPSNGER